MVSLCENCRRLRKEAELWREEGDPIEDDDFNPCLYCSLNNIGY